MQLCDATQMQSTSNNNVIIYTYIGTKSKECDGKNATKRNDFNKNNSKKKQVAEKKRATPSDITGLVLFFLSLDYAAVLMVHA